MDNLEYIKSIDIGNDGLEDSQFNSFENKLKKELDFYDEQFSKGIIDLDKLDDIKSDIKDFLEDYNIERNNIDEKYNILKEEILKETGLKLSNYKDVAKWQEERYEYLGIDKYTYKNSSIDRFKKGLFDALYVDNYELGKLLMEKGLDIFPLILESLTKLETWEEIAEAFGESIWDIFDGDAYEKGKAIVELGLISTGVIAGVKLASLGIKKVAKKSLEKTNKILDFETHRVDKTIEPKTKIIESDLVNPQVIEKINKKIEASDILTENEIKVLNEQVTKNNPVFGIVEKINSGDQINSMIFTGVKAINDKYSQAFTDRVINRFKKEVISETKSGDIAWNDYKNFVIKGENIDFSNEYLNNKLNKIFAEEKALLTKKELKKVNKKSYIKDDLQVFGENKKIKSETNEDKMLELAELRGSLEAKTMDVEILGAKELIEKIDSLKDKYSFNSGFSTEITDPRGRTTYKIENGVLTKEFEIGETGKKGIDKFIILDSNGTPTKELISLVRKGKIPDNLEIKKDLKQIIKSSIVNGEFIGPYILKDGKVVSKEILAKKQKLFEKLNNGKTLSKQEISFIKELSEKTFKGAYDKDTFVKNINKNGELFFIDIAGMGDINILDFMNKIRKYESGEITKKELLLKSGDYMTERFQNMLSGLETDLKILYPGKEIKYYIGGDEIGIFVEGVRLESKDAIKIVQKHLDKNGLEGRTTRKLIDENNLNKGGEKLFEDVDKLTNYSKIIESRLTETISKIRVDNPGNIEALNLLNKLKDFDIIEKSGHTFINFNKVELRNGHSKFLLEDIMDIENNKLIGHSKSAFINFLERNNLHR